jgi:hypothetical protein
MSRIFLSYKMAKEPGVPGSNVGVARRVRRCLEAAEYRPFMAADIEGGQQWKEHVFAQLRVSDAVVAVLDEGSAASRWCLAEWLLAEAHRTPVFPLLTGSLTEPPPELSPLQAIRCAGLEAATGSCSREDRDKCPLLDSLKRNDPRPAEMGDLGARDVEQFVLGKALDAGFVVADDLMATIRRELGSTYTIPLLDDLLRVLTKKASAERIRKLTQGQYDDGAVAEVVTRRWQSLPEAMRAAAKEVVFKLTWTNGRGPITGRALPIEAFTAPEKRILAELKALHLLVAEGDRVRVVHDVLLSVPGLGEFLENAKQVLKARTQL